MLEKLKSNILPSSRISPARGGIIATNKEEKPEQVDVSKYLMSLNRKERRNFKKKYGIYLPGTTRPVINTSKKK